MILLSHPTGNANVRNAVQAFEEVGALQEFWTCISFPDCLLNRAIIPGRIVSEVMRRAYPEKIFSLSKTFPWFEIPRLIFGKLGMKSLVRHEIGPFSVDAIYHSFDRIVAKRVPKVPNITAVYCYEDGALETFRAAKKLGIPCIYELPIGYWRAARSILREEARINPLWEVTMEGNLDSIQKLRRKDEELHLADLIVVASSFTKLTLEQAPFPLPPIAVIPYGAPTQTPFLPPPPRRINSPLRVIYVGSLSQRKGISYLFEAMEKLGEAAQLTIIGSANSSSCPALENYLSRHRYLPSLPNRDVLKEMEQHDVLVFPSLFEGFGLVILEAMSRGLPVIATAHTGAPDLFGNLDPKHISPIIRIRSSDDIVSKLRLLTQNPEERQWLSRQMSSLAKEYSWNKYREGLRKAVSKYI